MPYKDIEKRKELTRNWQKRKWSETRSDPIKLRAFNDKMKITRKNIPSRSSRNRKLQRVKTEYGVDKNQYQLMLESQNFTCPICNKPLLQDECVDHNHNTKMVRGILHSKCNILVGLCENKIEIVKNVMNYLSQPNIIDVIRTNPIKIEQKCWLPYYKTDINKLSKTRITEKTYSLRNKYNITIEEYEQIIHRQNDCCPICTQDLNNGMRIDVDHCHKTNQVRGIIHQFCNTILAFCNEDKSILINTIEYLNKYKEEVIYA
jgi:hypothetical protein